MENDNKKETSKLGVWTVLFASIIGSFLAFAGVFITQTTGWWKDSRDLDLRMVDIALAILAGEKGEGKTGQPAEARAFAIAALRQHSNVKMEPETWKSWVSNRARLDVGSLPDWPALEGLPGESDDPDQNAVQYLMFAGSRWAHTWKVFQDGKETNCLVKISVPEKKQDLAAPYPLTTENCEGTAFSGATGWSGNSTSMYIKDQFGIPNLTFIGEENDGRESAEQRQNLEPVSIKIVQD